MVEPQTDSKLPFKEIPLRDGGLILETISPQSDNKDSREAARIIVPVWGERYLEDFLSITLPALLAPGNLPALSEAFRCELVIVTERRLFATISTSWTILRILQYSSVRLVPIDDLLSNWYGITLTYALVRGFSDLGQEMVNTHLLFLNADFMLADGSYRKLVDVIRQGARLAVAPSYCMTLENTVDQLRQRVTHNNSTLAISHRDMAAMIIAHRHNTIRAKTVNQKLFRIHRYDQFYWYINSETMLARQMPIAVVYMRPERVLTEMPTFWDYGVISEYCPTAKPHVFDDSDAFLMAELRTEGTFQELLHLGWPSLGEIAADLSSFTTKDHRDYGRYTLALHSGDLPPELDEGRRNLAHFVDAIYERLSPPIDYRNHPFWVPAFPQFLKNQVRGQQILRSQMRAEAALNRQEHGRARMKEIECLKVQLLDLEERRAFHENDAPKHANIDRPESPTNNEIAPFSARISMLRNRLTDKVAAHRHDIECLLSDPSSGAMKSETDATQKDISPPRRLALALSNILQYGYNRIFGRFPFITPWHPFYAVLRHVTGVIQDNRNAKRILVISSDGGLSSVLMKTLPGQKTSVTPAMVKTDAYRHFLEKQKFELCFCDLSFNDLFDFRTVMQQVLPVIADRGRIVVFHRVATQRPLDEEIYMLTKTFFPMIGISNVKYTGSFLSARVVQIFMKITRRYSALNFMGQLGLAFILMPLAPLSRLATWLEMQRDPVVYPQHCTSLTMIINL